MRREKSHPRSPASKLPPVGELLLPWYSSERRQLPWRESPTPYSVWVSEIMLQQTRVETVIPYYLRFLERFPTLESLAGGRLEDVLSLWSGLGYYRRARSLHAGAQVVAKLHRGRFPSSVDEALEIPGIGPYTAGAILSIAYNLAVPIVDGNVERVLTRLLRIGGSPKESRAKKRLWFVARELIPGDRASDFNQAMMELGATVCTPLRPGCDRCPLRTVCEARAHGDVESFPEQGRARKSVAVSLHAAVIRLGDRYLLERREPGSFLDGLWLFPFVEPPAGEAEPRSLEASLGARLKVSGWRSMLAFSIRHAITFRRIAIEVHRLEPLEPRQLEKARPRGNLRWARLDELGTTLPVSSIALKIAKKLR